MLAKPPYGFQALGGVAVIANNTWAALQGRKKLKVEWDLGGTPSYDSEALQEIDARNRAQARQGGAQRGRRGCGVRQGG